MPEIIIHAVEGRSLEAKQALLKDIADAVVKNFGVHPDMVTVTIAEAKAELKGGKVAIIENLTPEQAKLAPQFSAAWQKS